MPKSTPDTLAAKARAAGVPYQTARTRLKRGLSLEEALQPTDLRVPKEGSVKRQCTKAGISHTTYLKLRKQGLSHDEALATRPQQPSRQFTAEQIEDILTSDDTFAELARRYNCSGWLISMIVHGERYAEVRPDISRREKKGVNGQRVSCWNCIHHRRHREVRRTPNGAARSSIEVVRCSLGFPDVIEEGAYFARFCNVYTPQSNDDPQP
jgi:hypothetical protein